MIAPKETNVPADDLRDPDLTVIYGVDTCEDTVRAMERFDAAGRPYRYVRLDVDTAIRDGLHELGHMVTPVVVTPAGDISVEPSDEELAAIIAATA